MIEHRDSKTASSIAEEAAEWFVRLKDGDVAPATRTQYLQWLKRSPSHIAEVLRICRVYGALRGAQLDILLPDGREASNVVDWPGREHEAANAEEIRRPHIWRIAAGVGACALAALLAVFALQAGWFARYIETQPGEWRIVELSDHSIARLGPNTKLRVRFDDERRLIDLPQGEAVFQVVKDPARPFVVNAGTAVVRAVGTEFGVSRVGEEVVVTVAEGQVAVARSGGFPNTAPANAEMALLADQQVMISPVKPPAILQVSATSELAWSRRRLIFDTETVAEAAAEFNRRNRLQILVDDPAIAARRACCNFDADDPESFAEAIAAEPDVVLLREEPGVLRIVSD